MYIKQKCGSSHSQQKIFLNGGLKHKSHQDPRYYRISINFLVDLHVSQFPILPLQFNTSQCYIRVISFNPTQKNNGQ